MLTNGIVRFEQPGPGVMVWSDTVCDLILTVAQCDVNGPVISINIF